MEARRREHRQVRASVALGGGGIVLALEMDSFRVLGALSATLGLIVVVIRAGEEIRRLLEVAGFKREKYPVLFYEVWFWGFITAVVGGFIWGLVWGESVGGDDAEPHGVWAGLWPIVTLAPLLGGLAFLNAKYRFLSWRHQSLLHSVWLLGAVVGSLTFYDCPIGDFRGFREYFVANHPQVAEFWLVFIWSVLVSLPAFLVMAAARWRLSRVHVSAAQFWQAIVKPVGLVVIVTALAVVAFLVVYADQTRFEQARGIVAALFLRIMLFISLFLASLSSGQASAVFRR